MRSAPAMLEAVAGARIAFGRIRAFCWLTSFGNRSESAPAVCDLARIGERSRDKRRAFHELRYTVTDMYLVGFVLSAINPWGGVFVAMPIALFKLEWPAWLAALICIPLCYVQVIVVDTLWERLMAWPWWVQTLEKRRSERLTNWLARDDSKVWLALVGVWFGPWLVAAFARFAGHPVGRVALPLLFGISYVTVGTAIVCKMAPELLK